jgi:hypothetical protein
MAAAKLEDKVRLTALAYLYQGKTPKEVEELVKEISYAQALRLSKELKQAQEDDDVANLFNLRGVAIDVIIDQAKAIIEAQDIPMAGTLLDVSSTLEGIKDDITASKLLKAELAIAGVEVVKKINLLARSTNSSEVLMNLAQALAQMQNAYFKTATVRLQPGDSDELGDFLQKP